MNAMTWHPRGYGGERRSPDQVKREGWREQGVLAIAVDDEGLTWPERVRAPAPRRCQRLAELAHDGGFHGLGHSWIPHAAKAAYDFCGDLGPKTDRSSTKAFVFCGDSPDRFGRSPGKRATGGSAQVGDARARFESGSPWKHDGRVWWRFGGFGRNPRRCADQGLPGQPAA